MSDFILGNESYFSLSHYTVAANDGFYSNDPKNAPPTLKSKRKAKFVNKILAWLAFSPRGMTRAFIKPPDYSINRTTFIKDCIKPQLLLFIR